MAAEVDTFPQDLAVQQESGVFPSVLTLQLEKLRLSSRDLPKAQQLEVVESGFELKAAQCQVSCLPECDLPDSKN